VVVRAVRFLAIVSDSTSMNLIVKGMVFLFFPAMREFASVFVFATISISLDKVLGLPLRALIPFIFKDMRLPSEILPIMCINTSISGVSGITIRAPNGFKMKDVEIRVLLILVQQIYGELFLKMSKCAHVSVVTRVYFLWERGAKLYFVFLWVVKFFHSIVRS
jgi:hypothetical protein